MKDPGNLVLYIILAVIAIAGSIQNSKKKKPAGKTAAPRQPSTQGPDPFRQILREPEPGNTPAEPVNEGYYEDPLAASFAGEGSVSQTMATAFANEGSIEDPLARMFASEGSIEDSMATAFAIEGISALEDPDRENLLHSEITEGEIMDAAAYDYNAEETAEHIGERFSLRKAVIFSAILQRKEYSF